MGGRTMGEPVILKTRDGRLDANDVDALADLGKKLQAPGSKLHLHLHGGLVPEASGEATARAWSSSADLKRGDGWNEAYVVWRTGLLESIRTNWPDLWKNDRLYQALVRSLLRFCAEKLFGHLNGGLGRGSAADLLNAVHMAPVNRTLPSPPPDWERELQQLKSSGALDFGPGSSEADLSKEFVMTFEADPDHATIVNELNAVFVGQGGRGAAGATSSGSLIFDRLSRSVKEDVELREAEGRGFVTSAAFLAQHAFAIGRRAVGRFRSATDHGLWATVVEEVCRELYGDIVGAAVWGGMKNDARQHFEPNGAGLALLKAIPDDCHLVVTAHSAGAIFASEMIKAIAAEKRSLKLDLIFMAPAVRVDLFAEALEVGASSIGRFRMYTMSTEAELADPVLGHEWSGIYPHSLLYLISGLLEEESGKAFVAAPLLGLHRYHRPLGVSYDDRQRLASERVQNFLNNGEHMLVYSPSQNGVGAGLGSSAISHGAFDSDALTLRSIATFMR